MEWSQPKVLVLQPICAKVVCEPSWKWETQMTDYDLWYVWQGEGTMECNGRSIPIQPQSCHLFRPGDRIRAQHNPENPLVVTYIHFVSDGVAFLPEVCPLLTEHVAFEALLTRYIELMQRRPFLYMEEARLALMQLLIVLARHQVYDTPQRQDPVRQAIYLSAAYIREHPGVPVTIDQLAQEACMSKRYFAKRFKQFIGRSVKQFIIESKLERADYLLRHSGMNVSEIAEALEYNDIYFFSRQFKKHVGRTPSEVQNSQPFPVDR
jgi:AraC-like DNA-binding protein